MFLSVCGRLPCREGFAEKVQIPGFTYKKGGSRKKKTDGYLPPAGVLINFVGEKEFKSACVEEMLQNSIPAAMETVAATALQDSERIETAFDELVKAFSGQDCAPVGDLIYVISVEVVPTINWTGDYRKLKVTVTAPGDDETDALEAESLFKKQLRSLGTMRVVMDRGLQVRDQVVMDLDAVKADTGEAIEGGGSGGATHIFFICWLVNTKYVSRGRHIRTLSVSSRTEEKAGGESRL